MMNTGKQQLRQNCKSVIYVETTVNEQYLQEMMHKRMKDWRFHCMWCGSSELFHFYFIFKNQRTFIHSVSDTTFSCLNDRKNYIWKENVLVRKPKSWPVIQHCDQTKDSGGMEWNGPSEEINFFLKHSYCVCSLN